MITRRQQLLDMNKLYLRSITFLLIIGCIALVNGCGLETSTDSSSRPQSTTESSGEMSIDSSAVASAEESVPSTPSSQPPSTSPPPPSALPPLPPLPPTTSATEEKVDGIIGKPSSQEAFRQVPEKIKLTSIGIMNNSGADAISIEAELKSVPHKMEILNFPSLSYVLIPGSEADPVSFLVKSTKDKVNRTRCLLKRGHSYQVFTDSKTNKLVLAEIIPTYL